MTFMWDKVPEAIRNLYRVAGESIVVKCATDSDPSRYPFSATPEEIIAREADITVQEFCDRGRGPVRSKMLTEYLAAVGMTRNLPTRPSYRLEQRCGCLERMSRPLSVC